MWQHHCSDGVLHTRRDGGVATMTELQPRVCLNEVGSPPRQSHRFPPDKSSDLLEQGHGIKKNRATRPRCRVMRPLKTNMDESVVGEATQPLRCPDKLLLFPSKVLRDLLDKVWDENRLVENVKSLKRPAEDLFTRYWYWPSHFERSRSSFKAVGSVFAWTPWSAWDGNKNSGRLESTYVHHSEARVWY